MPDLTEASVWSAGVYRIERSDAVIGADPLDPANIGISNRQAKALADRTRFLRDMTEGAGIGIAALADVADFNAVTLGGHYRAPAGTPNAPTASHPYLLNHLAGNSSAEAVQIAVHSAENRTFMRRRTAGTWQPWAPFWIGVEATFVHAATGWQRLPSGLILQWGLQSVIPANTTVTVTLPIAFPTAFFRVFATRAAVNTVASANMAASAGIISTSQFSLSTATDATSAQSYQWLAIGA